MESQSPWWKGKHGEWYVIGQLALMALVFFGPRTLPGWPVWPSTYARAASVVGAVLMAIGALLLAAGMFSLGSRSLTPMPYPREGAVLVQTGPYRFVRHPIYSGGILIALGWALLVNGWLTIGYAVLLFVFFDIKSRREEHWLKDKFPGYAAYQRRACKLIPFLY